MTGTELGLIRGWTLLMGNARPECLLRGLKFPDKKIMGSQIFRRKFKGP